MYNMIQTAHTFRAVPRPNGVLSCYSLNVQIPSTVRVFLAALKQFYSVMHRAGWYQHSHPLTDPANHLLHEIEMEEYAARSSRHRMPQMSGVEKPKPRCPSENYFRLVEADWIPQPIDDPKLPEHLRKGFQQAKLCLRDQIVVRLAYETGARISEILRLTVGDWRARGFNQEAKAFSKVRKKPKITAIPFNPETARMQREN